MRLRPDQLSSHLAEPLAAIYAICGNEPLQLEEGLDQIRAAARNQGYLDRVVLHVEPGYDWGTLCQYRDSLSLFSDRRFIDLRMPTGKPGAAGAAALRDYAARPNPDCVLLVSAGKLERREQSSAWFKALEANGVAIQVWPVNASHLPRWIQDRARSQGLELDDDAAGAVAERVEGNLLACAQEIDKLRLLHEPGRVTLEQVLAAVGDSARFSVYDLADSTLAGDGVRTVRILAGLREEGTEPSLVSWALAREIRAVCAMAGEIEGGAPVERVLANHRVWDRRKGMIRAALRRHSSADWIRILHQAAAVDRVIKGARRGDPWDELLRLGLSTGGMMILREYSYN